MASPMCLLLACLVPGVVLAQNAELSGFVKDPGGAVVPNAAIEVRNHDSGVRQRTTTNGEGLYSLQSLRPGTYLATVQANGFKTLTREGIVLEVAQRARLDVTLELGAVEERVTVEASVSLVNTTDGSVGTVTDRAFVENLPMNGRSFQSLIDLTPGVVLTKSSFQSLGQFSVNGQRNDANYFTVDGVSANAGIAGGNGLVQTAGGFLPATTALGGMNNLVSVDALQEFRVQTSTFAPEYGRTPGAQVQIVTRSGSNEFHGVLFDYFRNTVLDANDWFSNSRSLKRAPLQQNDFGFVLGGPVWLPKLYNGRNKTFFFVSYEGLRLLQPITALTQVPTLATRQNAPVALRPYLNSFPLPNGLDLGNGLAQFNTTFSNPSNLDATSFRIDQSVGTRITFFGRYNQSPSDITQRGAGSAYAANVLNVSKLVTYTATGGMSWIISPPLTNEFRANYSRNGGASNLNLDTYGGATPIPDSVLFPSPYSSKDSSAGFLISGGTQAGFVVAHNADNTQQQWNFVDNLSWTAGKHSVKFGVDYRRINPTFRPYIFQLVAGFTNISTVLTSTAATVNVIADNPTTSLVFKNFSGYVQDTWKMTPRLTLTYGLRYEVNPAPTGDSNIGIPAVTGFGSIPTLAIASSGTPTWNTTWNNWAPRLGGAYQFSQRQNWALVLRGGFGVFFDPGSEQAGNSVGGGGFPYGARKSFTNVIFPLTATQLVPPAIVPTSPIGTFYVFNPDLKLPYVLQWNISAEQALGASQSISASYIAATGHRLLKTQQVIPTGVVNPALPGVSAYEFVDNTSKSNYQALQLQFRRRLSKGLQALLSYSWSHSIDDASSDSPTAYYVPPGQPDINRANSDFDVRHAFSGALTYNVAPLKFGNAFVRQVLGHWAVDTLLVARTPTPINILVGTDLLSTGSTSVARPNRILDVPLFLNDPNVPGGKRFNRAAFATPAAGQQGTLGRNSLQGFNFAQLDVAFRREFVLRENFKIQFRGEIFNLLNHPNFADPVNSLSNASFGLSTAMYGTSLGTGGLTGGFSPLYQLGGPRLAQLAIKIVF